MIFEGDCVEVVAGMEPEKEIGSMTVRITFETADAFDEYTAEVRRDAAKDERKRLASLTAMQLVAALDEVINPPMSFREPRSIDPAYEALLVREGDLA